MFPRRFDLRFGLLVRKEGILRRKVATLFLLVASFFLLRRKDFALERLGPNVLVAIALIIMINDTLNLNGEIVEFRGESKGFFREFGVEYNFYIANSVATRKKKNVRIIRIIRVPIK